MVRENRLFDICGVNISTAGGFRHRVAVEFTLHFNAHAR
jgi:hypothetical protein